MGELVIDGNYETLTISKPEFKQFLFGPNVHRNYDVVEILIYEKII